MSMIHIYKTEVNNIIVQVSEMIGCDGPDCQLEWFHFECVGEYTWLNTTLF